MSNLPISATRPSDQENHSARAHLQKVKLPAKHKGLPALVGGSPAFPGTVCNDRRCAPSDPTGFTLIEVLTAMGMFCFAVLGLLYALNVTLEASRDVDRQKVVRGELENRLARLSLPPLKEFSATIDEDGVQYIEEIRRETVKTEDLNLHPGYWRIQVLAAWKVGTEPQQWDVSHLIWSP